jgi:hypothetical protein
MWKPASEAPTYLDVPGAPWVLVTLSSEPQTEEMTLVRTALRTLAEFPVRIVLTPSDRHPRDELGSVPARLSPMFLVYSVTKAHILSNGGNWGCASKFCEGCTAKIENENRGQTR